MLVVTSEKLVDFFFKWYLIVFANYSFCFEIWINKLDILADWVLLINLIINVYCVWVRIALDTNIFGPAISNFAKIGWDNELTILCWSIEESSKIVSGASSLFQNTLFDWTWLRAWIVKEIIWIKINSMLIICCNESVILFFLLKTNVFDRSGTCWACCLIISGNKCKECQDRKLHFFKNLFID